MDFEWHQLTFSAHRYLTFWLVSVPNSSIFQWNWCWIWSKLLHWMKFIHQRCASKSLLFKSKMVIALHIHCLLSFEGPDPCADRLSKLKIWIFVKDSELISISKILNLISVPWFWVCSAVVHSRVLLFAKTSTNFSVTFWIRLYSWQILTYFSQFPPTKSSTCTMRISSKVGSVGLVGSNQIEWGMIPWKLHSNVKETSIFGYWLVLFRFMAHVFNKKNPFQIDVFFSIASNFSSKVELSNPNIFD